MTKSVIFTFVFIIFCTLTNYEATAEDKYIMKSGNVYYGKLIKEFDNHYKIKEYESDLIIRLNKEQVDTIQPLLMVLKTDTDHEIKGYLINSNDEYYFLEASEGAQLDVEKSSIISIGYIDKEASSKPISKIKNGEDTNSDKSAQNFYEEQEHKANQNLKNDITETKLELGDNFAYVGAGLGTPAVFNIIGAYHLDFFTLQIHGGFGGQYSGAQSTFYFNLLEGFSNKLSLKVGVCSGYRHEAQKTYRRDYYLKYDSYSKSYITDYYESEYIQKEVYYYYGLSANLNIYGFFLEAGVSSGIYNGSEVQFLGQFGFNYRFDF